MGELYRLRFASGKCYIGITTKRSADRFHGHAARARRGNSAAPLYIAWRKHGAPALDVLAILENDDLAGAEIRAIQAFCTMAPHGYNASPGGDISPMTRPEVAAKVSSSLKGRLLSATHRAALSAAQRGKPRPALAAALAGKRASAETRAKMSASALSLVRSDEHLAKLRLSAEKARAAAALKRKERGQ